MFPSDFLRPSPVNVSHVMLGALGAAGFQLEGVQEACNALGFESSARVCVMLIDGLGYENLAQSIAYARSVRAFTSREDVTSVVPSTTAAAITSVGTGALPGQTAMMGYSLRSPATGKPFSLIQWDDKALSPIQWQSMPTLFERCGEQARDCRLIQPRAYVDSGLTLCALRGASALTAQTPDERVDRTIEAFRRGARFVYLYWGDVDKAGHIHGWHSEQWVNALEECDAAIARLMRELPRGTQLILTADHGMIDVEERIDMAENTALRADVDLIAGEERAVHVYTSRPDEVAERWANELGERAWVVTKDEVNALGLCGEMSEHAYQVSGDVFAFMRGGVTLVDSRYRKNPHAPYQKGVHGSLTPMEMRVPVMSYSV